MADILIIWGDWTHGKLVNTLVPYPGPDSRMVIPIIVAIDTPIQKYLALDVETQGVNKYGEPGGLYFKVEIVQDYILPQHLLMNGDSVIHILCGFFGQQTPILKYIGELEPTNYRLNVMVNTLRAENRTILEQYRIALLDFFSLFKQWRNLVEVATIYPNEESTSDENDLEKGGNIK